SLLAAIDLTRTPMGARMLRRWLTQPLLDPASIGARHDAVGWLAERRPNRERLCDLVGSLPDLERLAGRAAQQTLNPREMLAIAASARVLPEIVDGLRGELPSLLADMRAEIGEFRALADQIERTIEDPPPANFGEGVIRSGCSPDLDE